MNPVSISSALPPVLSKPGVGATERAGTAAGQDTPAVDGGFGEAMKNALDGISKMQGDAGNLSREFQLNNPNVSLEETMIALQKASLGFQAAVQVRNKLVTAYNDIMNMSV